MNTRLRPTATRGANDDLTIQLKRASQDGAERASPGFVDPKDGNEESGNSDDMDSIRSADTDFSETTSVPQRHLGYFQITALMLNLTIGGGIFTTPGYVLALTESKSVSLGLWAAGGVYTALRFASIIYSVRRSLICSLV